MGSLLGEPLPLRDSNRERLGRGEKEASSLLGDGKGELVGDCVELPLAEAQGVGTVDPLLLGGREGLPLPLEEGLSTDCADDAEGVPPAPPLALPTTDSEDCGDALRWDAE